MKQAAIDILDSHRIMAVSTVRPDGWPQTTFVGYANEGFDIFFVIFRSSQKFANIAHNDHISIAVGEEPDSLNELRAVYAAARASEVTEANQRAYAWALLERRHPNLAGFAMPDPAESVIMRASCRYVSVLDYTQGFGHREELNLEVANEPVP